jgi:hypothetical protein
LNNVNGLIACVAGGLGLALDKPDFRKSKVV